MVIFMLEHIVKNGERIEDILNMYHLELDELIQLNLHITDFYNLMSGTKIKIPLIHNETEQILDNTESFVQQYYPKIHDVFEEKIEVVAPVNQPVLQEEEILERKEPEQEIKDNRLPPRGRPYPGILPPKNPYKRP